MPERNVPPVFQGVLDHLPEDLGLVDNVGDPDVLKDTHFAYELCQLIFCQGIFEDQVFSRGDLERFYIEDRGIKRNDEVKRLVGHFVNSMAEQGFLLGRDGRSFPQGRWIKRSTKLKINPSPETLANFFDWAVQLGKQAHVDDTSIGYLGYTAAFYRNKVV